MSENSEATKRPNSYSNAHIFQLLSDIEGGKLTAAAAKVDYVAGKRGRTSSVTAEQLQEVVNKVKPEYFQSEGLTQGKAVKFIAARFNSANGMKGLSVSEQRLNNLVDQGSIKFPVSVYRATRTRKNIPAAPANNSAE